MAYCIPVRVFFQLRQLFANSYMLWLIAIGGYADSRIVFKGLLRITSRLLKIPVVTVITTAKPNAQATVAG